MAPRTTYASLPDGLQLLSLWDQSLADMGLLAVIPCTATGTNALTLTPIASVFAPNLTNPPNPNQQFSFVAPATSTGNVTIQVVGANSSFLNLYRMDAATQAASGDIQQNVTYIVSFGSALNSAAGGYQILAPINNEINPIISGATITNSTITTSTINGANNTLTARIANDVSGLGTGVATALGVNVGSAGAFVPFNGALGTPSSGVGTNLTGLPISTGLTGAGTGVLTALGVNVGTAGSVVVNGGALGSPSSAGTIPAFTLGGTIAGGGNQINNVVIGTSTPLAGTFTTLAANTSLTTPIRYGGSGVGSTALINGTSNGSPSSAFVNIQSNGQFVSIGNTSPKTNLDINANLSSSPALVVASSLLRVQAADGSGVAQEWTSYGAGGNAGTILQGAAAGGTAASPSATANGQYLVNLRGAGYNSGWQSGGLWIISSSEAWSAGHQGTQQQWYTTPNGSTTIAIAMTLNASGGLGIGTATDPGIGAVLANTSIKSNGATAGIGYATGAGGTVTQATSRTTGVTLSKVTGAITMFSAAGSATAATFTVTNTAVAATDVIHLSQASGTNLYNLLVTAVSAGSFNITFFTTGGTATDAPVINFAVIKGVTS